jgi:hypothetical protein
VSPMRTLKEAVCRAFLTTKAPRQGLGLQPGSQISNYGFQTIGRKFFQDSFATRPPAASRISDFRFQVMLRRDFRISLLRRPGCKQDFRFQISNLRFQI